MGTPIQWVEVLASGAVFYTVFVVFSVVENDRKHSRVIVLARSLVLIFGSFGFGMIESFGRRGLHEGLLWVFSATLTGMIASGIVLRRARSRTKAVDPD